MLVYLQFWRKVGGSFVAACPAGTFCLDTSTLAGAQYRTVPFDMEGEFRDMQLRWYQNTATQDMEPHYLELFTELIGADETLGSDQPGGSFTLGTSTLGGTSYRTVPFDMSGEFRDVQLRWYNPSPGEDMEPHYLELAFELLSAGEEDPSVTL